MALEKLEIDTYQLERGEYYIAVGNDYDLEAWHRIFLACKADANGIQKRVELQFATDRYLEDYIAEGVGYVSVPDNTILIRYRLAEFEPIYNILRSEDPVFFEHDQFNDSSSPERMRVHSARITTSTEDTGEGPKD